MKFFQVPTVFLSAALAASSLVTASRAAEPPAPAKPQALFHSSNWQVECGNNGTVLDCATTNSIIQNNGEQLAFVTLRPAAIGGGVDALVQLPLGIALLSPVQLAVDGKSPVTLPVSSCTAKGCIASAHLPPSFVSDARKGQSLAITFGAPDGQKLTISIGLHGFGLAYDRLSP